ncbi:MAG: hypothetical protein ACXU8A_02655, partial [Burkholderiaceae bacterium]
MSHAENSKSIPDDKSNDHAFFNGEGRSKLAYREKIGRFPKSRILTCHSIFIAIACFTLITLLWKAT